MMSLIIYLDGGRSQCGYKFVCSRDGSAWCAFRTDTGFRYFMEKYGLKIDPSFTQINDLRAVGKGRNITTRFFPKDVQKRYFWTMDEVPVNAKPFIQLENGSYVSCYALDEGNKITVYVPNPNAKEVYRPFNWADMADLG